MNPMDYQVLEFSRRLGIGWNKAIGMLVTLWGTCMSAELRWTALEVAQQMVEGPVTEMRAETIVEALVSSGLLVPLVGGGWRVVGWPDFQLNCLQMSADVRGQAEKVGT